MELRTASTGLKLKNIVNHPLFYWALVGMLLRYSLGLFTSHSADVEVWYRTGLSILYGTGVYERMYFAYPPIWGYILGSSIKIGGLVFDPRAFAIDVPELKSISLMTGMISTTVTSLTFNFIFKTPLFIADLLIGYILYKFILELTDSIKKAKTAFLLWFFNPLVIVVSAMHGTFDAIVTLLILLAAILIYKRNYFWAGGMWMFGILTKIFPIYFGPLFIGIILSVNYHNSSSNTFKKFQKMVKGSLWFIFGASLIFVVIFLPLFYEGTLENATGVFRRVETGVVVGGVSPWFIRHMPEYSWVFNWAYNNPTTVLKYSNLVVRSLLGIVGIITLLLGYRNPIKAIFYGSVATLSIIYLTAPIVNAQYLIWIFPFLIVVSAIFESKYKHLLTVITFSGLLFYFSLMSIWHLMLPLAVYTNLLNIESIVLATQLFWTKEGVINTYLRDDLKLASGFLGVLGIILCLFPRKISYLYIVKESISEIKRFVRPGEPK
jgi:hypothetical protein